MKGPVELFRAKVAADDTDKPKRRKLEHDVMKRAFASLPSAKPSSAPSAGPSPPVAGPVASGAEPSESSESQELSDAIFGTSDDGLGDDSEEPDALELDDTGAIR